MICGSARQRIGAGGFQASLPPATASKEEQRCLTSSESDAIFQVGPFPLACLKQELPPWFWERMNVTRRAPGNWVAMGCILGRSEFFLFRQELLWCPLSSA